MKPKKMKPRPNGEAKPPVDQEIPMHENMKSAVGLAQERIGNAQTLLQLRNTELANILLTVRMQFEENGKYEVTNFDVGRYVVTRRLRDPNTKPAETTETKPETQLEAPKNGAG